LTAGVDSSDQVAGLRFNIINFHPFFCDYKDLGGKIDFKKIIKRELIKPFAICHTSRTTIHQTSPNFFEIRNTSYTNIDKIGIKITIEEI
jgi:hypothetical protein